MFQTITFKGFEAQVTARITGSYSVGLIYLEIAGALTEVRAIWSRLVSAKVKKAGRADGVTIGDGTLSLEKHTKYLTLRSVLPNGQQVIGLLHPRATVIESDIQFYIVASADHQSPPPEFFPRLARSLAVPIKEKWAPWLWEKGLETGEYQKLIYKLTSYGHAVGYRVNAHDAAAWLKLIQEGIGFKVCDYCSKPVRELVEHAEVRGYGLTRRDVVKLICQKCEEEA